MAVSKQLGVSGNGKLAMGGIVIVFAMIFVVRKSVIMSAIIMSRTLLSSSPSRIARIFDTVGGGVGDIDRRDLTFTNFGWFHPDPELAIKTGRFKSSAVYADAVVRHPRYNSSAWTMLSRNPDPARSIVAFIDVETCGETCWPVMCSYETSVDLENGRSAMPGYLANDMCDLIERALGSPAMMAPESRLVVMSCFPGHPECLTNWTNNGYRNRTIMDKLVVAHQTAHRINGVAKNDMGIPPLPIKPVVLNASEREDIANCRLDNYTRPLLFFFKGRHRFQHFGEYWGPLHGTPGVYANFGSDHYTKDVTNVLYSQTRSQFGNDTYMNLLRSSRFAGAPRGDCLYSYRFSEVLSAGAMPVVYADGWILPYTEDVVDWNDVSVLLPQVEVNRTMDVLKSFDSDRLCEMQQKVVQFYDDYVRDSDARLRGILKALEGRLRREVDFSFAPGSDPGDGYGAGYGPH